MYAMDQTMHFEHRAGEPPAHEPTPTRMPTSTPTGTDDVEADPTHAFLD